MQEQNFLFIIIGIVAILFIYIFLKFQRIILYLFLLGAFCVFFFTFSDSEFAEELIETGGSLIDFLLSFFIDAPKDKIINL